MYGLNGNGRYSYGVYSYGYIVMACIVMAWTAVALPTPRCTVVGPSGCWSDDGVELASRTALDEENGENALGL